MHGLSVATITGAAVLAGCASTPVRPASARIVVLPSRQLTMSNVQAEDRSTFILVRGHVRRRGMMSGPVWGHLHLEAWGAEGILACEDTRWTQLRRRRLTYSFFSAAIQAQPSRTQEVRISHVTTSDDPCPAGIRS